MLHEQYTGFRRQLYPEVEQEVFYTIVRFFYVQYAFSLHSEPKIKDQKDHKYSAKVILNNRAIIPKDE